MRTLSLDISTKTGWACFEDDKLVSYGLIKSPKRVEDYGTYPDSYVLAAQWMIGEIASLAEKLRPDRICVEETNKGKNRYTQKILEFTHCFLIYRLGTTFPLNYVNTMDWRKKLGLYMSKEDKKRNTKLNSAKRKAEASGKALDKKALGIKGKVTVKHLSVRYVNANFGLSLKQKDNDIADAICLGEAFIKGAPVCNGRD